MLCSGPIPTHTPSVKAGINTSKAVNPQCYKTQKQPMSNSFVQMMRAEWGMWMALVLGQWDQ